MVSARRALLGLMVAGVLANPLLGPALAADTQEAVDITISDASAKVGEQAYIVAKIVPHAGFEIASNFRNRVGQLSANDNTVEFAGKFVRGTVEDGALVFKVPVTPKKAGANAINGVMRFGFVSESDGQRRLDIKVMPLIATVTGM